MAATAQTQGFLGVVKIGGVRFTTRANPQFRANRNLEVAPVLGTTYPSVYGRGMMTPTVSLSLVPRDVDHASPNYGNCLGSTFLSFVFDRLNALVTPTTSPNPSVFESKVIDVTPTAWSAAKSLSAAAAVAAGGIVFSDGASVTVMGGVKLESFRIGTSKGQDISVDCTFVGTWFRQFTAAEFDPDTLLLRGTSDCSSVLRFQNVTVSAPLNDKVFGFSFSYSNNHSPNMALDKSLFPADQNAGMASAGLSLTVQALDAFPDESLSAFGNFQFTVTGTTGSTTINVRRLVVSNPYDRSAPLGRVLRNYNFTGLGYCTTPNVTAGSIVGTSFTGGW